LSLRKLGKQVDVACDDKVPDMLMYLHGAVDIMRFSVPKIQDYDLLFAVDVSDSKRLGAFEKDFLSFPTTCQIDHHETNELFARHNAIDKHACATGILAYSLIQHMHIRLDTQIARCLYTAISSDTGNFSFESTSARAFEITARLMKYPIHIEQMSFTLFRERSPAQLLLLAHALGSIRFYRDNTIAVMTLTQADFLESGALWEHTESIVNFGINTTGVMVAFLAAQTEQGDIKLSLRSQPPVDVSSIAVHLGGGGHRLAAGCTLNTTLQESVNLIISMASHSLAEKGL
jgi:phosphoesterase RecJ-like protein